MERAPETPVAGSESAPPEPPDAGAAAAAPPVEGQLAEACRRADEYLDALRRLQAEFENYRKRIAREHDATRASIKGEVVLRILPVLDNLERAVATPTDSAEALSAGLAMILQELRAALERLGLARLEALGRPFDPERHEAVYLQPTAETEPDQVVAEVAPGYTIDGRLIRPARVAVSVPPAKPHD